MISVVDYGVGNLGSILNMLRHIDVEAELVSTPEQVERAGRLLLPGVGAFDHGMEGLRMRGLDEALVRRTGEGVPVLGVCLGMQLLTEGSEEGVRGGLGLVPGHCQMLAPVATHEKVPHMGWDWSTPTRDHPLVHALPSPSKFYFAHSFHVVCAEPHDVLATSSFAAGFTSMFVRDNLAGAQFHPEKSHRFGMSLLAAYSRWSP